ncbi:hypothetical protein FRX31_012978 [Thalictrum thalictroides]|uniref:Uncharacterized protein n=1 Tax=Thalictrum thalictroides TaxID=46969 RepID=A0A7J6WLY1_THATH|nr:hypothetical protein FRX31_012978 [Thalictrum thalictroides]
MGGVDALADFNEEKHFFESSAGDQNVKYIYSVLELYKASEIMTYPDDLVLETLNSWTSRFLKQGLENGAIPDQKFKKTGGECPQISLCGERCSSRQQEKY